jgi:hypothetical protein
MEPHFQIHPMHRLDHLKVVSRALDAAAEETGARLLRGQVFAGVDTPGRSLGQAARAPLGDADGAGEFMQSGAAPMLGDEIRDSLLRESRHVRGKL